MKREEFLNKLGISLVTICAGSCLAACGKSDSGSPSNNTGVPPVTPPPAGTSFTIDLNNELKNVGESKTSNGIILVRITTGNATSAFTAVQVACPHEGTSVGYSINQARFICPNHGSQFTNSGTLLNGPATSNLKPYAITLTGTTLTVTV